MTEEIDLRPYKLAVLNLAEFYGQNVSENQVLMYARVLSREPIAAISAAIEEAVADPAFTRMPLPAAILARARPVESDDTTARTIAAMIISAVSRFGWPNQDRAKEFLGEVGWKVVELQGGWTKLCQTLDESNITTFQAQWRDLALSILRRSKAGTLNTTPVLPQTAKDRILQLAVIKEMPKD